MHTHGLIQDLPYTHQQCNMYGNTLVHSCVHCTWLPNVRIFTHIIARVWSIATTKIMVHARTHTHTHTHTHTCTHTHTQTHTHRLYCVVPKRECLVKGSVISTYVCWCNNVTLKQGNSQYNHTELVICWFKLNLRKVVNRLL